MIDVERLTHVEVSLLWNQRASIFVEQEIDLASNKVIDSAGIAFLLQWAKALPKQKLIVKNASENVRSLIKTFHLDPMFEIV